MVSDVACDILSENSARLKLPMVAYGAGDFIPKRPRNHTV